MDLLEGVYYRQEDSGSKIRRKGGPAQRPRPKTAQPFPRLPSDREDHAMVVLAEEPLVLLVDQVVLEEVAFPEDLTQGPGTRLVHDVEGRSVLLGDEPVLLLGIWHQVEEVVPARVSQEGARGALLTKALPPPGRGLGGDEVMERCRIDAVDVQGRELPDGCRRQTEGPDRVVDRVGNRFHEM